MDNRSKKLPLLGGKKIMFTPNLGYKRIVAKEDSEQANIEVKSEYDPSSSAQPSTRKPKKERSTTQVQSVFSNMSSNTPGRSSHVGLSSGFRSYSNQGSFNRSGSFVKTEACQSIQQMQMLENNQFDIDDPVDNNPHGPIRLPFFKKHKIQVKTENSLEYPSQENVYPALSELMVPESLMILQFYDSSFSTQPKIANIDLTKNGENDTTSLNTVKTDIDIKKEYNGHIKNEFQNNIPSKPIGKVQYFRSGRVLLIFNGKKYELLKANEDIHHKELFSLSKIAEAERPDKLVSLGTVPVRLKAVMDINCLIENFLTNNSTNP